MMIEWHFPAICVAKMLKDDFLGVDLLFAFGFGLVGEVGCSGDIGLLGCGLLYSLNWLCEGITLLISVESRQINNLTGK